ncbi:PAS domain-containing protein [Spirosoma fluviale]|uniref:histidine kinase n=1 Tax=Spirosoma fluviale TaxID=1597977 RepID=A0A286G1S0_9BACT|nr:PAS domain-containing protein [Spirosoma fluviale]SOD89186.1 PAS domain S-box-containing protein [Spirosoma fluviale]
MIPVSASSNALHKPDLSSSFNSTVLYHARRGADGKITDFSLVMLNSSAQEMWGYSQHELAGRSISQLFAETDWQFLLHQFSLVVEYGRSVRFEMEHSWQRDPSVHRYDMLVTKLEDGVLVCYSAIVLPAQTEPVQQQTDLLRKLFDDSSCLMQMLEAVRDEAGEIVDFVCRMVNQPCLDQMRLAESQVVGQRMLPLFPGLLPSGAFANWVAVMETGETRQQELYCNANGYEVWVDARYIRHNDGVIATGFDLTATRLAERKHQQQAELYKTILDTALTSITVLEAVRNTDGKIIDLRYTLINQERLRLAGKSESFFMGKRLTEVYPGMVESGVFDRWVEVIETRQPQKFEVNYHYDGFDDWSLCLGSPFGDGIVVSYTDITKQKEDELQARQQADLLNSIQNTSQIGISACKSIRDAAGTIIDFQPVFRNATASHLHRHPPNEPIKATLLEDMPSLKPSGVFDRYVRVVESGQPDQFEQHFSSGGLDGWFEFSVQPWEDGFVLNILDTTSLRQAEREKVKQSTILQQVVDNSQAGLVLARPLRNELGTIIDFRYVLTNEYNARITGWTVAAMADALVSDLFPGWQSSDLFRRYAEVVESGQPQRLTFPYEAYGMEGWFDGSFSCVDGCLLYTYTDVTPLKEAELAQQQYASLLEQVMNMTPAAIVLNESIRNEAGEIVDLRMTKLNQMAVDLLRNPIEKVQFRRVSNYIPGSLDTPLFAQCKGVIETGNPARLEVPWGDRWYDFSLARFGDGVVLTVHDITPMREYRQKLELANLELKRSNENLQSFAFVSSHDLQEPLRKIISFADILTTQYAGQFDAPATDIVKRINTSANRMRLLIQDLLAYSQVDTRQDSFEPVNLTRLIGELQEHELWMTIQQSNAEIHLGELPTLMADRLQMRQLFQNLLSNAIKFCPKGDTPSITVSSRLVKRSDLSVQLMSSKLEKDQATETLFAEISVADNGIGFDEKYLDRIFQVFQRLHGRSQYSGSGIGLAICYKIAERHNGAITASSQPGQGSTFRVYLPVRKG